MSTLTADLVEEVKKQAIDELVDLNMQLVDQMLGVGDQNISRADRIARFVDYAERGVLDALKGMGAPVYDKLVREYKDDMMHSPYMEPKNG